ncbi:MAG: hypothetical protein V1799_05665 [bacterium]
MKRLHYHIISIFLLCVLSDTVEVKHLTLNENGKLKIEKTGVLTVAHSGSLDVYEPFENQGIIHVR